MFYEQLLKIGQGTFGEVFKARCKRTGQLVALKKILMENEKEGFPITALREIKMLKLLKHPNITELIEVCTCKQRNARDRFSFYLVFTFCEHDLAGLLSTKAVQKFSLVEIKTMAKHILEGLNKIHKSNILHRDMKSANVLITSDGILKLADFGLARLMIKQHDYRYTNRVVTLWYRPPELLLGSSSYGPAIDIWGAGCIIAELWIRAPILQGNTEQEQLQRISKLCGSLNPQNWPGIEQLPLYGKLNQNGVNNALPQTFPRRVCERIGPYLQQNELALLLIDEMLSLNPEKRPTAEAALDNNFFWETPLPAENIKELVDRLRGQNLFEYLAGCGAHANRKRPAPPAPSHNGPHQKQQRGIENNRIPHPAIQPPNSQKSLAIQPLKSSQLPMANQPPKSQPPLANQLLKNNQQSQHFQSSARMPPPQPLIPSAGSRPPSSSQQNQQSSSQQQYSGQRGFAEKDRISQPQMHNQVQWAQQYPNSSISKGPQPLLPPPNSQQYLQSGVRYTPTNPLNRFPQSQPDYTRQPPPEEQQPPRFFNITRF